jgi:hypothetical protein
MVRSIACLLIVFTIVGGILTSATAQTFDAPVKVSGTTAAHSPLAKFGRNGDLYVAWFANAADIYFARSADAGSTFSVPVKVSSQITSNIYTSLLQRTPRFVVDTRGVIHMTWTEERMNGQNDIWYVRSTDRGNTWTMPKSIMDPDDSATYPQDFCNIACDSSDNLYVAYLDFRGVVRGVQENAQLYLTRSLDGGATWTEPVVANKFKNGIGGTCECCKLDIAVTRSGAVDIAFRSNIDNKRDVWLARSSDRGVTFDSTIRIQTGTWTVPGCPTTGPSIGLDAKDNLYFAWRDSRDDSMKAIAYYSMLLLQSTTLFPNRATSRSGLQDVNWPSIGVSWTTGGIGFIYQTGANSRVRFTYSADGGNAWTQDIPVTNATGGAQLLPTLAFSPTNQLVAVWQEGGNAGAIYSAVVRNLPDPAVITGASPMISDPSAPGTSTPVTWHPASNGLFVWYAYAVQNIKGDTLYSGLTRDTLVTIPALSVGRYLFSLTTHRGSAESALIKKFTKGTLSVSGIDQTRGSELTSTLTGYRLTWNFGLADVRVIDLMGRLVREDKAEGSLDINTQQFTPGLYAVTVVRGDKVARSCFLVR